MKYLLLILPVLVPAFAAGASFAMCAANEDWPDAPYMDMIASRHFSGAGGPMVRAL